MIRVGKHEFLRANARRLALFTGVRGSLAGAANAIPFNPSGVWTEELQLKGRPKEDPPPEAQISITFPRLFRNDRIPPVAGRTFTVRDRQGRR